jgi:predicted Zn-dependent peptidase
VPPQTGSRVAAWPEPRTAETAAGLRLTVLERPGPVAAVRLTVGVGARHGAAGAAHLFEHLVFRTAQGAAARLRVERLGGEIGATTTREQISLDAVVVPEELSTALDALSRIASAQPTATDLERERPVVQRELAHEEEERRKLWQLQAESLFGAGHPLAQPILGSAESLAALDVDALDRVRERWLAGNATLAVVGPVDADAVSDAAEPVLQELRGSVSESADEPAAASGRRHEQRRSRTLHLAVGWRFGGLRDPRLPALRLAEIVLAHGSGSRLYARLRTQRGIAYRISTVLVPYAQTGHLSAVTACDPHHARAAELAIVGEFERLALRGPSWQELGAAKRQLHGSLARAFESSRRLAGYAATQLLFGTLRPLDDELAVIDACSPEDVAAAAEALVRGGAGHAVASIGRLPRDAAVP